MSIGDLGMDGERVGREENCPGDGQIREKSSSALV